MINQMTRLCTLARSLEANQPSLEPGVFRTFKGVFKSLKKSVRNLKTEKSLKKKMLKSLAADNCDVLQFTIVEAEDLAILDRFHKVDPSCVAYLTHGGGQASKIKLCTNVALQTQDPTWNAQFSLRIPRGAARTDDLQIQVLDQEIINEELVGECDVNSRFFQECIVHAASMHEPSTVLEAP